MKPLARSCLLALCFWATGVPAAHAQAPATTPKPPQLVSARKIWNGAQHNAFTDLIRFKGQWLCTFREADGHVRGNGQIRVVVSPEGEQWVSAALLKEEGVDLRDPKLSITPDNRLMLVMGGSVYQAKKLVERQPRTAFSKDGRAWTSPRRVLEKNDWLWRVTWHQGHAYGVAYTVPTLPPAQETPAEWTLKLVESEDGVHFRLVTRLEVPSRPNEATVRFLGNGDCVALVRREGLGPNSDKTASIGVSRAPYQVWQWKPAGLQIGGPNFIVLPDGSMIAGGRQYGAKPGEAKTFIGRMDLESVTPQLVLPSGGDCSYPGLAWHDGLLWVSYYSSHEGQTSIYLAKVAWPAVKQ